MNDDVPGEIMSSDAVSATPRRDAANACIAAAFSPVKKFMLAILEQCRKEKLMGSALTNSVIWKIKACKNYEALASFVDFTVYPRSKELETFTEAYRKAKGLPESSDEPKEFTVLVYSLSLARNPSLKPAAEDISEDNARIYGNLMQALSSIMGNPSLDNGAHMSSFVEVKLGAKRIEEREVVEETEEEKPADEKREWKPFLNYYQKENPIEEFTAEPGKEFTAHILRPSLESPIQQERAVESDEVKSILDDASEPIPEISNPAEGDEFFAVSEDYRQRQISALMDSYEAQPLTVTEIREKAEEDDAANQLRLGLTYLDVSSLDCNLKKGMKWIKDAAENGDSCAQLILSTYLATGFEIERSEAAAAELCAKSAEQGNLYAQSYLGFMYFCGRGVEKSQSTAFEWFTKAAEQGDVDSQSFLAMMYDSVGGEGSAENAFKWFSAAAEQGDVESMANVGRYYLQGLGIEKSVENAIMWLEKAAEQGHEGAKEMLASIELEPCSDVPDAISALIASAEGGDAVAMARLGAMYLAGDGVEQSDAEALKWLKAAIGKGVDIVPAIVPVEESKPSEDVVETVVEKVAEPVDEPAAAMEEQEVPAEASAEPSKPEVHLVSDHDRDIIRMLLKVGREDEVYEYLKDCETDPWAHRTIATLFQTGKYGKINGKPDMESALFWYRKAQENGDDSVARNIENIERRLNKKK